ncbi:hypothetical protein [Acinetobacter sp. NS-4]|uniref:hypothetical protein n=1 Tax=Acinetobacter sp. NS-4 TaxID=3127956 RepID=UPI00307F73AC
MKTVFRQSLTTLMCVGTLMVATQSWAKETQQVSNAQEQCPKPCAMKSNDKSQQNHSQHHHGNMADMSQMDHSKMMNMDHSNMGDMDHSKMSMSNLGNK